MWQGLIYGPDGIDRDIVYNLIKFYERLGIQVRFSVVLEDASIHNDTGRSMGVLCFQKKDFIQIKFSE